jgi:2-oxoisovalerate dehydrogenase E1 component beta subunit
MAEMSNVQAVSETLRAEFRRDERYIILGEDVAKRGGVFRVTEGFLQEFGEERVIDTPLAEASIVGVAIGAAVGGLLPVAEIQFADFSAPAFEQIVDEAARMRYRSNGAYGVPLTVRVPSTPRDIAGMLRSALRDPDPVIFLEHKATYRAVKGDVPDDPDFTIPLGPADVKRDGTDITVFAYGLMLQHCLKAADVLQREDGVSVAVVDVRSLRPLDEATIVEAAKKTGKCLVVYEDNRLFGAGAEICALIAEKAFEWLDAPVMRIGGPEAPATAFAKSLEDAFMPNPTTIATAMRQLARY